MSQQMLSRWIKRENSSSPVPDTANNTEAVENSQKNGKSRSTPSTGSKASSIDAFRYSDTAGSLTRSKFADKLKGYTVGTRKRLFSEEGEDAPKKAKSSKLTPLEQQIYDLKMQHRDKLLAIQVGYKYKFYGEDARAASQILNIMFIPGRLFFTNSDDLYDKLAYCSIPDVRLHIHLKRLLSAGYKVAVVDQNETAAIKSTTASKNKLFERRISKVYTSSTYIDNEDVISGGRFVVALTETKNKETPVISLVAVDVYSADIIYDEFEDNFVRNELETRLYHLDPTEFLLIGEISRETQKALDLFKRYTRESATSLRSEARDAKTYTQIADVLNVNLSDEAFDLVAKLSVAVQGCFAELVEHMIEFELANVFDLVDKYTHFSSVHRCMILDANTLRNLEIYKNSTNGQEYGSLLWMLDHTNTQFGRRELRRWIGRPLTDREEVAKRADSVESIMKNYQSVAIESTVKLLRNCPDLEAALSRIHYGRSKRKDTYMFLKKMNEILQFYGDLPDTYATSVQTNPSLREIFDDLKTSASSGLKDFRNLLDMVHSPAAIDDTSPEHVTGYFNTSFFDYHLIQQHLENISQVEQQLEAELKEIRKIVGRPGMGYVTNNKEPYLVEVRNTQVASLPKDWLKINGTKSVSRFRTPSGAALYRQIQYHSEMLQKECNDCFTKFVKRIDEYYLDLNKTIRHLAVLDSLISLSAASSLNEGYTKPVFVDSPCIDVKNSRNPISENLKTSTRYIPNDFKMSHSEGRIALITGPNMGGKSSFIRQIALLVVMAQIGCYIPADSGSKLSIFDSIHTRMGAQDDIIKGESTFQVELKECSTILKECGPRSLVLMDEVGRGTSTMDGFAIAHSILRYLVTDRSPFVLFITHYQNLRSFERFKEVKSYHMGIQKVDEDIVFTYKLSAGCSDRSYGINCAKLAGLPKPVLESAHQNSVRFENDWRLKEALSLAHNFRTLIEKKDYAKLLELAQDLV
ncbi:hypothetical protein KL906_004817 [Ogataea polymorpha]|nr:hypothetical protein KL906_004817 [Ogataea polymorpha]